MSPRAASRLESLGFEQVYAYVAGKADWGGFGLPLEGTEGSATRAGAHVRTDAPNCRRDERLLEICERLEQTGWDTCYVLDEAGVVLGRIGRRAIRERADVSAEEAMTLGEHRQTQRPARSDGRPYAAPEPDQPARYAIGRPAGRTAEAARREGGGARAQRRDRA